MEDKIINKEEERGEGERVEKMKRGRKKKGEETEKKMKDKNKYYIDVTKNKEQKELIQNTLDSINNKEYGKEITIKDILLLLIHKIGPKDIEKLQESSLSEMEKIKRALDDHNKKNDCLLTMGEFLTKKLGIS